MAYGDKLKIETVVANLLDNAVKYMKGGGSIKVQLSETEKTILVEVTDTGIGIQEEELLHVFDVFYRADRTIEGTGAWFGGGPKNRIGPRRHSFGSQ